MFWHILCILSIPYPNCIPYTITLPDLISSQERVLHMECISRIPQGTGIMVTLLSFDPDHLAPNLEPDAAFDQGSGRHQQHECERDAECARGGEGVSSWSIFLLNKILTEWGYFHLQSDIMSKIGRSMVQNLADGERSLQASCSRKEREVCGPRHFYRCK